MEVPSLLPGDAPSGSVDVVLLTAGVSIGVPPWDRKHPVTPLRLLVTAGRLETVRIFVTDDVRAGLDTGGRASQA